MRRRGDGAGDRRASALRLLAPLGLAAPLAVALVLTTACAPSVSPTSSPAPTATSAAAEIESSLPDGVTVELRQARSDVADRQASVRVINASSDTLQIGAVAVTDPRFAGPAERLVDRVSTLSPGRTVDVRVQLADVVCDGDGGRAATVTVDYERNGVAVRARVPISDPVPFVAALHERECVRDAVLQAAAIGFGAFAPAPAGEPASLGLLIQPRADAADGAPEVRIVGIRETNLLTFERLGEGGLFPIALDLTPGSGGAVTVSLPLRPARCDPHAVLEDKRGTVFRLLVEVDGDEGSFDLAASPDLRGRLLEWVAQWCGFGTD